MTPWTVANQTPLSMGFSRQEYWSGLLFSSPGDLPDPGIEPVSCVSCTGRQVLSQLCPLVPVGGGRGEHMRELFSVNVPYLSSLLVT